MRTETFRLRLTTALERYLKTGTMTPLPAGGDLLWHLFTRLCLTRSSAFTGPNPISYSEIQAFAHLERWPLEPRHIAVIQAMDVAWLKHCATKQKVGNDQPAPKSEQSVNPDAFDAVWG